MLQPLSAGHHLLRGLDDGCGAVLVACERQGGRIHNS